MVAPSVVAPLFARSASRRTGVAVEQELLARDGSGASTSIDWIRAVAARSSYAPFLGFEPGGQVELSLPVAPDAARLGADLCAAVTALRADCDRIGVQLWAEPLDPRPVEEVPLQLVSPRYLAMQRHFDTIGPAGRRMMRTTASTQVCLDWWPGRAGLEQWRVLQLAGPFLAAAYARSTGPGSRLATWLEVDPARTAFDDRLLHGDPVRAYADFAAGATVFVEGGPVTHLTTLFPPVRPRGRYLEVRFLDAQPEEDVAEVAAALAALAYDDARRARTLARLAGEGPALAEHWRAAALGDPDTAAVGHELVRDVPALGGAA
ncbi:glutamate-cysteine ligase family protein [Nocardioides sp.]|uniref:glutamate-cysteine ligase family protein n=1 Tax=Nocardioides sp. TaxID=35761 RepID=UPI0035B412AB